MLAVGLTGGIGAGKSTVAAGLVARGALLVDADRIAREVVAPGGPAHQPLVDRFGPGILAADGTIDRPALAKVAFTDPQALADLNAITHPAVGAAMLARRQQPYPAGAVVLFDIPLLRPEHRQVLDLHLVVVVDCPVEVALDRLVAHRGMDRADAEARVAAQMGRAERLAGADLVVDNGGDLDALQPRLDDLWAELATGAEAAAGDPPPGAAD